MVRFIDAPMRLYTDVPTRQTTGFFAVYTVGSHALLLMFGLVRAKAVPKVDGVTRGPLWITMRIEVGDKASVRIVLMALVMA